MNLLLNGDQAQADVDKEMVDLFDSDPQLRNTIEHYEMTVEERQYDLYKRTKVLYEKHGDRLFRNHSFI